MKKIEVEEKLISITSVNDEDYICLTDMVRGEEGSDHIRNWMRNRNTVEFLGLWEQLYNPNFKTVEFDTFKKQAGLNSFNLTPKKWTEHTHAIGILSKSGRYGGTYAHKDIAFEFGAWISPMFKLLLIKEFQRLKEIESNQFNLEWDVKRILSKANYTIHTDAIKKHVIPELNITKEKKWLTYADETDVLNIALFGCTAKQWREANPELAKNNKNMRDFASINQLTVLSNLEVLNSELIKNKLSKNKRFQYLYRVALQQLAVLDDNNALKALQKLSDDTYLNQHNKLDT
ncbi:MAG: KilA-N domain-containing protein [Xanthomarina gelatinilytica]|uniref:KilA-N domain-containing protein n=1 Tax=Xanthomarina gelatinilytica TaxID=1137281 RepID=UPI003A845D72